MPSGFWTAGSTALKASARRVLPPTSWGFSRTTTSFEMLPAMTAAARPAPPAPAITTS